MATGVVLGLQSRCGAPRRPGWVRFPHVPAIYLVVSVGFLAPPSVRGQTPDSTESSAVRARQESPLAAPDTTPPITPLGAFGRSLVLPGWGQTILDRPVPGAIYFSLEAVSLFMLFRSQARLNTAKRAEPPNSELVDSRVDQREDWIALSIFWAFLSGLDAWVATHLWDFEAEVVPPEAAGVGAALQIRVPIGPP